LLNATNVRTGLENTIQQQKGQISHLNQRNQQLSQQLTSLQTKINNLEKTKDKITNTIGTQTDPLPITPAPSYKKYVW
jgi:chromosome segregation ATPase